MYEGRSAPVSAGGGRLGHDGRAAKADEMRRPLPDLLALPEQSPGGEHLKHLSNVVQVERGKPHLHDFFCGPFHFFALLRQFFASSSPAKSAQAAWPALNPREPDFPVS